MHNLFILLHNYSQVNRKLKENKSLPAYKIKDIYKKNYSECEYIFNVEADDETKTIYQAGYCDCSVMWSSYCVADNYQEVRLTNFYNNYKKGHNISFKLVNNKEGFFSNYIYFTYNEQNKNELKEFIKNYFETYPNLKKSFFYSDEVRVKNEDDEDDYPHSVNYEWELY